MNLSIRTELISAYRFFREHAGYRVGHSAETAMALARAELRARDLSLIFMWEDESEPWDGDVPLAPTDLLEWAACYEPKEGRDYSRGYFDRKDCGRILASLGMVATTGYSDPYRRVVEAELASEALDTLDAERDAIATLGANKLAQRATFAGPGVES